MDHHVRAYEWNQLEKEHDCWKTMQSILERIRWESEYGVFCVYQNSGGGYGKTVLAKELSTIYKWNMEEDHRQKRDFEKIQAYLIIHKKVKTVLNIIFARIDAGRPLP